MKLSFEISAWELDGLVYLNNNFRDIYQRRVKHFGVAKFSDKLDMGYGAIADVYRRDKPIRIHQLLKSCRMLNIDINFAERSIVAFTQNLKTKYHIKFPIKLTPLSLRLISMIVGDGNMTNTLAIWSQHKSRIGYGYRFLKECHGFESLIRPSKGSDCCVISLPKFFVENILQRLGSKSPKNKDFFEAVTKLPREWQFQVFAQIVVDEGSPDNNFQVSQMTSKIADGIEILIKSLGYRYTRHKRGFYIKTESIPDVMKDFALAVKTYGEFGGFWFKDDRFNKACKIIDPKFSENLRMADEKFQGVLNVLRVKQNTFNYKDIKKITDLSLTPIRARMNKYIREGKIIRLDRDLYTFSEKIGKINSKWLSKSKEEKVLWAISEQKINSWKDILDLTKLSQTQMYRAINNLLDENKITRIKRDVYQLQ